MPDIYNQWLADASQRLRNGSIDAPTINKILTGLDDLAKMVRVLSPVVDAAIKWRYSTRAILSESKRLGRIIDEYIEARGPDVNQPESLDVDWNKYGASGFYEKVKNENADYGRGYVDGYHEATEDFLRTRKTG